MTIYDTCRDGGPHDTTRDIEPGEDVCRVCRLITSRTPERQAAATAASHLRAIASSRANGHDMSLHEARCAWCHIPPAEDAPVSDVTKWAKMIEVSP